MPRKFCTSILRLIIGGILLFTTIPKVEASPAKALQGNTTCQKKISSQDRSLKQSEKILQGDSEADSMEGDKISPSQSKKTCKTLKTSEGEDSDETPTDANADELGDDSEGMLDTADQTEDVTNLDTNASGADSRDVDGINSSDSYIPDYPAEQLNTPLSQDSHDTTINLDLNLGGGEASPIDSTDATTPETDQPDTAQPTESSSPTSTSTEEIAPQPLAPPKSKAKVKKLHLKKIQKAKVKQEREKEKAQNKRDRLSHPKRGKNSLGNSSLKNHSKSDHKARKSLRNHPGRIHSKPHRSKANSSLKRRSHFQPGRSHFRKQARPNRVLRTPSHRTHQLNRRHVRH
jgi:hypothetical protein